MEELWKMFPEFAHCVKPPFKVLSIPAAKYWSPESSWRPRALQRIDRLCRFTLRRLDELSVPWYKTMTTISSIYVTGAVVMNFKIGFWAAIGKLQIRCDSAEMADKGGSVYSLSDSDSMKTYIYSHKPKYQISHQKLSKLPRILSQFPLSNAGVDASLRGKTGLGSKVNCAVTLWWVLRLYFPVTLLLHRLT